MTEEDLAELLTRNLLKCQFVYNKYEKLIKICFPHMVALILADIRLKNWYT